MRLTLFRHNDEHRPFAWPRERDEYGEYRSRWKSPCSPDQRREDQVSKTNHLELQQILLSFAGLTDAQRQLFISQMNKYLLASSSQRKQLVEQWRHLLEPAALPRDALND